MRSAQMRIAQAKRTAAHEATSDPVCGMPIDPASARFRSNYGGKVWYFCAETCKREFDGNPAKFAGHR